MHVIRTGLLISAVMLGVCGCGTYDPPVQAGHAPSQYHKDLADCRASSRESVRLKNARTLGSWVKSPFTGPPAVRAAIRTCMQGKGYTLVNASE